MERDAFLSRLRPTATVPQVEAPPVPPAPLDGDLVSVWRERAAATGVVVHDVGGPNQVRQLVLDLAGERGITDFCSWEDRHLPVHGIAGYLTTAGLAEHVVGDGPLVGLAPIGLGITGADALLAETGSIVLTTGSGRSRLASLVGKVHVVVASVDVVEPSLRAAIGGWGTGTSNTVVVTGPSRTGDIEGVLVKGVHGPAEVHVALLQ